MKTIAIALLILSSSSAFAEGGFRDRLREKIRERIDQRREKKEGASAGQTNPADTVHTLSVQGVTRHFRLHVPASLKKDQASALLIALHGGGGNMDLQAEEKYYHLISKSDSSGFIVAFPNGYSRFGGKLATWNAGKCCGKGRDTNSDDVGFIRALIEKLSADYRIDQKKIFITGMSNGAMMSYRLACELSGMITGIAAVAGTDNTIDCKPTRPLSVLHIHAKNDDHVLFNGGAGPGAFKDESMVTSFTSVPATIEKWVKLNGCSEKPKRILEKTGATCDLYSGCRDNVHVQLCVTDTGGHSWPGGEKPRGSRGGEGPSQAISANDIMWSFFEMAP